jgi:ribonuclease BN (tRNA processing enzyme)
MPTLDLICLGVGKGSSSVLRGLPSTAFALRVDGRPELLIDCGAGVALSYRRLLGGALPARIYLSHNHHDHAGDLPIVLLSALDLRASVLGHPDVLEIVREHRLHDGPEVRRAFQERIEWVAADARGVIALDGLLPGLALELVRSRHSYLCYGFVLRRDGDDLLGYTADSGFEEGIYARVTRAPVAILDGREQGNADHASFAEIEAFARRVPGCDIRVVHYEETDHRFAESNVRLLREGEVVPLGIA